jgi:hypothetical protein
MAITKRNKPQEFFNHATRPIRFSLIVNANVGKEHADHLLTILEKDNEVTKDWEVTTCPCLKVVSLTPYRDLNT